MPTIRVTGQAEHSKDEAVARIASKVLNACTIRVPRGRTH